MPDPVRLSCVILGFALEMALGLSESAARADEPVATTKPLENSLPEVFSKPEPESISDLKAIESHLKQLLPRLQAATVALRIGEAHGSGVLVSASGLVMTAGHVSGKPGRDVEVTLPDGSRVRGHTLGRNRNLDSGLVQIDGGRTDWPFCPREANVESKSPTVIGEWCVVLGHPGGYQAGRTAPVRLGRVVLVGQRLLQTDCELVGGDSGGPLFNMRGDVIGINSRIGQPLEFNFHVPTSAYQKEWDKLARSEDLKGEGGALLGLSGQGVEAGLKVIKVFKDEPAAEAGIRVGDIVVTFAARRITTMEQLIEQVDEMLPGDEVRIELLRDGKRIELTVELDMKWD